MERFSHGARSALTAAQKEAKRRPEGHQLIDAEHILLALIQQTETIAAKVLTNLGADIDKMSAALEAELHRDKAPTPEYNALGPRAKQTIELAIEEARLLKHDRLGTEHLLLGLLRTGESAAASILEDLNVGVEAVRAEVLRVLESREG